MNNKAKVFVSCGQRKDFGEAELAEKVGKVLEGLGFDVYLGIKDNTLDSVRENLFPQLEDSEYFLFIDFRREPLGNGEYRGSLFSHQELALATYLEFKERAIGFHESGGTTRRAGTGTATWQQRIHRSSRVARAGQKSRRGENPGRSMESVVEGSVISRPTPGRVWRAPR
jgi:hypothetical protein